MWCGYQYDVASQTKSLIYCNYAICQSQIYLNDYTQTERASANLIKFEKRTSYSISGIFTSIFFHTKNGKFFDFRMFFPRKKFQQHNINICFLSFNDFPIKIYKIFLVVVAVRCSHDIQDFCIWQKAFVMSLKIEWKIFDIEIR